MRMAADPDVQEIMKLYFRHRRYGVLPRAGGLDDQDARVLDAFDAITVAYDREMPQGLVVEEHGT